MKIRKQSNKTSIVSEPGLAYEQQSISAEELLDITQAQLNEPLNRINAFRKGFKRKSLIRLKEATGLDYQSLAFALSVSTKTLQRAEVFDVVQSEKMYELAELYATGMAYFGEEGFKRWMDRPLFTIGNRRPLELLDVSEGVSMLRTEILRLQHGIGV